MNKVMIECVLIDAVPAIDLKPLSVLLDVDAVFTASPPKYYKGSGNGYPAHYLIEVQSVAGYTKPLFFRDVESATTAWNLIAGVKPVEKSPPEKFPFSGFNILIGKGYEYTPEAAAIKDYIQMAGWHGAIRFNVDLLPGVSILVMDGPATVGSTIEQVMEYCQPLIFFGR